jgi:hypothetical protein
MVELALERLEARSHRCRELLVIGEPLTEAHGQDGVGPVEQPLDDEPVPERIGLLPPDHGDDTTERARLDAGV